MRDYPIFWGLIRVSLVLAALLLLFSLAAPQARSDEDAARGQTVVVHLSSYTNDLHAVTMSLKIAALLAAGNLRQGATLTTDTAIRDLFLAADKVIDY